MKSECVVRTGGAGISRSVDSLSSSSSSWMAPPVLLLLMLETLRTAPTTPSNIVMERSCNKGYAQFSKFSEPKHFPCGHQMVKRFKFTIVFFYLRDAIKKTVCVRPNNFNVNLGEWGSIFCTARFDILKSQALIMTVHSLYQYLTYLRVKLK